MTAVPPFPFPGSRVLADWWKHLVSSQPRALWVGHLLFHRVEAAVEAQPNVRLDALSLFILQALALAPGSRLEEIDQQMGLGWPMLRQLIRQLEIALLVQAHAGETWSLGPLGHEAVARGAYRQRVQERRSFYFLENDDPGPHFLNLTSPRGLSLWPHTDGWHFPLETLSACFQQSEEWKRQHGFPLEVHEILRSTQTSPSVSAASSWEKVILDHPEHLFAVLILVPQANGDRLLGFAVQSEGWILFHKEPAFALQEDWQVPFPQLRVPVSLDLWQQAWREWCQLRGLPSAEVDACGLQLMGCRIRITAPVRLVERLRAERSDICKGQAWLLAGTGRLRAAAQMELHSPGAIRSEERGLRRT